MALKYLLLRVELVTDFDTGNLFVFMKINFSKAWFSKRLSFFEAECFEFYPTPSDGIFEDHIFLQKFHTGIMTIKRALTEFLETNIFSKISSKEKILPLVDFFHKSPLEEIF